MLAPRVVTPDATPDRFRWPSRRGGCLAPRNASGTRVDFRGDLIGVFEMRAADPDGTSRTTPNWRRMG